MTDFSQLCPSFGIDGDLEDEECQNCTVKEDCMDRTTEHQITDAKQRSKVSPYGHRTSALTGQIDWLLYKGTSAEEILGATGCSYERLRRHFDKLRKMGFPVLRKPDGRMVARTITIQRKGDSSMETQVSETMEAQVQVGRSPNNHRLDSAAGQIDALMYDLRAGNDWPSAERIAEEARLPLTKVKTHINYWRKRGRY